LADSEEKLTGQSPTGLLLRPVTALLNRGLQRSVTAQALAGRLEGRVLAVSTGVGRLDCFFVVQDGQLRLNHGAPEAEPDATLRGTPLSLGRLGFDDPAEVLRSGSVEASGDTDVLEAFQALLELAKPDWEEELAQVTGDVVAFEAGKAVRRAGGWARHARRSLGRSLAEYLTEERRDLVARAEVDEFCADVDQLSAAVDRCQARLALLREYRAAGTTIDSTRDPARGDETKQP